MSLGSREAAGPGLAGGLVDPPKESAGGCVALNKVDSVAGRIPGIVVQKVG